MKMRHKIIAMMIGGAAMAIASCDFVTSDNGDLDGMWQMTFMEDQRTQEVTDARDKLVTWAFQGSLVQMNSVQIEEVTGEFSLEDNSLRIWNLNHFSHATGDTLMTDMPILRNLGIYSQNSSFHVLELSKSTLRLENDSVRISFRKY